MTDQQPPAPDTGAWEAFWDEIHAGARTETIRGVTITVPTDMPLRFERRMEELRDSEEEGDAADLVAELFGTDALDTWIDNGMGAVEFKTLIAWGIAQGNGHDISFREAYERVRAADEGKPAGPNRAARRAASKKPSASTGGRSKRTSNASTGSTPARSRS